MTYKLTLGLVANLCAATAVFTASHAIAASAAVTGFLALMLFAGSVMDDLLAKQNEGNPD